MLAAKPSYPALSKNQLENIFSGLIFCLANKFMRRSLNNINFINYQKLKCALFMCLLILGIFRLSWYVLIRSWLGLMFNVLIFTSLIVCLGLVRYQFVPHITIPLALNKPQPSNNFFYALRIVFVDTYAYNAIYRLSKIILWWHTGLPKTSIKNKLGGLFLFVVFLITAVPPTWWFLLWHYLKSLAKEPLTLAEALTYYLNLRGKPAVARIVYYKSLVCIPL